MKSLSFFLRSIIFLFLALIIFLSLVSYVPRQIPFLTAPSGVNHNFIGIGGAYLAFGLFFIFGYAAYFFPFYLFLWGLSKFGIFRFWGLSKSRIVNLISFFLFATFLSALIGIFPLEQTLIFKSSGVVGFYLGKFFKKCAGFPGSFIILVFLLLVSSVLLFGFFFVDLWRMRVSLVSSLTLLKKLRRKKEESGQRTVLRQPGGKEEGVLAKREKIVKPQIKIYTPKSPLISQEVGKEAEDIEEITQIPPRQKEKSKAGEIDKKEAEKKIAVLESESVGKFNSVNFKLPSSQILKLPPSFDYREVKQSIEASIKNLEDTLSDFGVETKVVGVQKGPVVTMYELQPQAGVKIHKISALADDIALAMKSSQVRVVAPLPGRGTVGVEIPNEKKHLVYLREVLEEPAFTSAPSKLTLALGKDVSGNPVITDLGEMPHLLIAGTTGSGKTVCINSLISSILFKAKPHEVKFILIDPKMVELAPFSGIPHLLHPIISEIKKAFIALNWTVEEMERRYQLLAEEGVRNIEFYNKTKGNLPYIVIVIDELADLMILARDRIETSIQRLAQLARAVGIHLILATQRPSVDVITGVIKANFPARVSFKVSSKVDSRTVLDTMGADKLLGKGDLLFLKPQAPKLIRAQGAFIDDEDIENLTHFLREQGGPVYEKIIIERGKKTLDVEGDELFDEAVKIVLNARQASASILQRRLRVGYTRAARLLDLMEQEGVVGPFCGSKAREILVDANTFLEEKG